MWNLITVDTVRPIKGGSPYMMAHEAFHHTFTLPLLNRYAPLTINYQQQQQQQQKEFPEFKQYSNRKMVARENYINQGGYDCINRIMDKQQKIHGWFDKSPIKTTPQLDDLKQEETPKIDNIVKEIDRKFDEVDDKKKRKKRRRKRRKNRNKRNKNQDCCETRTTTKIESNLERYDSLKQINLIKQRQRHLSTDSDDSFIVFYDDNDKKPINFDNIEKSPIIKKTDNKKVRFADDDELCEVHPMVKWSYAYQAARRGPWEEYARDRDRFKKRVKNFEKILLPIFNDKHRQKIYNQRFLENKLQK